MTFNVLLLFFTPDPQDQDVDVMVTYLSQLVMDKNLEQVDLLLKFLYRYTLV
jgi:hypothetical protein